MPSDISLDDESHHDDNLHTDALHTLHNEIRRYVPGLFPRLALTYGLPMVLVLTIGTILVPWLIHQLTVLPASTRSVLVFGANLALLVYSWRLLENRTNATSLFGLYVRYSRARREMQHNPSDDARQHLDATAATFLDAAREAGIEPAEKQKTQS